MKTTKEVVEELKELGFKSLDLMYHSKVPLFYREYVNGEVFFNNGGEHYRFIFKGGLFFLIDGLSRVSNDPIAEMDIASMMVLYK